MKNWKLSTFAASLIISQAACSKNSGPGPGPAVAQSPSAGGVCKSIADANGALNSVQSLSEHQDPFELHGKVILESERSQAEAFSGSGGASEANLAAGTEMAVTLRQPCLNAGEIARSLLGDATTSSATSGATSGASSGASSGANVKSFTWRLPQAMTSQELKSQADADSCVVGISEAVKYFVKSVPNDPYFANEGHLSMLEASTAYDLIYAAPTLRPVVIAILDTGIDMSHPDLKDVLWQNASEVPNNGIDDDSNGYVDDFNGYNFADNVSSPSRSGTWSNQHGTHVSGLAAAQANNGIGVSGVMGSNSRIMMLNVFGQSTGAYVSDIANAIRYAADNGADVINLSVGGSGRSATYESALGYAVSKGVTVVVAAGNEASEIGGTYFESPASYSPEFVGMLAVASVDSSTKAISTYSNYSARYVEIAAPGSEDSRGRTGLLSTWPGGGYARIQGTSMASPVVAGSAGLAISMMRSRGYSPSPATIEGILTMSSETNQALKTKVQNGNLLNLRLMAQYISSNYPVRFGGQKPIDPGVPGYKPCNF